jgi:hypothetical protein
LTAVDELDGRLPVRFISKVRAAVAGYTVLLALLGDRHYTYYPVAARTLAALYLVYATAILLLRWRRSPRGIVVWALVGVDTGASTVLTGLTGGGESPVAPVMLLVVTAVAIRFGLRRAAAALSWTVPLLVSLILLVPDPSRPGDQRLRDALWWTAHLTAIAVMAGVLSDRLNLAHRRRAQAEADTAVEPRIPRRGPACIPLLAAARVPALGGLTVDAVPGTAPGGGALGRGTVGDAGAHRRLFAPSRRRPAGGGRGPHL